MSRKETAIRLFKEGYGCAQAVLLAFSDVTGLSDEQAAAIASSFGGGMGRMREVCGAVSGMFMAAGLLFGYSDPKDHAAKAEHYRLIRELAGAFREANGSIICRELLTGHVSENILNPEAPPEKRTEEYYKKRPCPALVGDAAEILERCLLSKND